MTINEQLHASKLHRKGIDQSCPVCNPLIGVIKELERCAKQNEKDASIGVRDYVSPPDFNALQARAVAAEQRRMIGILKRVGQ